ncbi:hypothetical protein NKH77_28975 [Streptomyces sp. M19]
MSWRPPGGTTWWCCGCRTARRGSWASRVRGAGRGGRGARGAAEGHPIVLAIPFAGDLERVLPQKLADRTGLTVWAHSGQATLSSDDAGTSTVDVLHAPGTARGEWTPSSPPRCPTRAVRSGTPRC